MTEVRPLLLDVPSVIAMLSISRSQLYKLFDSGDIKRVHIGARSLVHIDEVERFAASLTAGA
jgi:predicted DNA-binding transcriptional regulator AlpA